MGLWLPRTDTVARMKLRTRYLRSFEIFSRTGLTSVHFEALVRAVGRATRFRERTALEPLVR
jgi:hypothetical protein